MRFYIVFNCAGILSTLRFRREDNSLDLHPPGSNSVFLTAVRYESPNVASYSPYRQIFTIHYDRCDYVNHINSIHVTYQF